MTNGSHDALGNAVRACIKQEVEKTLAHRIAENPDGSTAYLMDLLKEAMFLLDSLAATHLDICADCSENCGFTSICIDRRWAEWLEKIKILLD